MNMRDNLLHIYFDMDGVLADFDRGVRELCHREPLDQSTSTEADNDALWAAVRQVPHFYGQLEPIPGSLEMLRTLYEEIGDRCQILTGIPKPRRSIEHAGEDKVAWIHRLVSEDMQVHIVYREEKRQYCTGPQDILVDDYDKNIREWQAAGGTGILFRDPEQAMQEIRDIMNP